MPDPLDLFLDDVDSFAQLETTERQRAADRLAWLSHADLTQWQVTIDRLRERSAETLAAADPLLSRALHSLSEALRTAHERVPDETSITGYITLLYRDLGKESWARAELLRALAWGNPSDRTAFAELLVLDPPSNSNAVVVAFSPLFRQTDFDAQDLFPRLLDGLSHLSVAAPILDLANYMTRTERLASHPASERAESLSQLLGQLTQRLERLRERGGEPESNDLRTTIDESVALTVSICDAMGLIGDRELVGKLYQAMELSHRRIRTEAAAALARLGEQPGKDVLVEMAAEPSVRRFAITFAEELGLLEQVAAEHQTLEALAISDLAVWLSQPVQLGLPPLECDLLDQREQYWPGYDEPVHCFLIRFCYRVGEQEYANVGIAGPLTHAFADDLLGLPPDEIYAAFAGWAAEHAEISELPVDVLSEPQQQEVARLESRLRSSGYDAIQPSMFCLFFGKRALVARSMKDGRPAIAVVTDDEIFSRPIADSPRPLSPELVYQIYKGRQLLRTFNE